ncbi:MAG: phosphate acyltransferase [Bradymonadia bacterium]
MAGAPEASGAAQGSSTPSPQKPSAQNSSTLHPSSLQRLPVALDAMGGPGSEVLIRGAIRACRDGHGPILLVGREAELSADLDRLLGQVRDADAIRGQLTLVDAPQMIGAGEHPGRAARTKTDSSIHVALRAVQQGDACAMISSGNTGALLASALLTLRRVPQCDRPAVVGCLPTERDPIVLLDVGANQECRASHLMQFALMGSAFAQHELGLERPRVGLLSGGTELSWATETHREAHRLLVGADLNYLGPLDAQSMLKGEVDVVVADGFTGRIAARVAEAAAKALMGRIRQSITGDWIGALGARLLKKSMRRVREALDDARTGAAPLLGVEGVAVAIHGQAAEISVVRAVQMARRHHEADLVSALRAALLNTPGDGEPLTTAELPITRATGAHSGGGS